MSEKPKATGLARLREPFEDHQISLLPKPTKKDAPKGTCKECGGYHGLPAVHLKYVGHAALTDRLLEADEKWNWEPLSFDAQGLPNFDKSGGLWIKLTVCGVSRLGYGHAESSTYKEVGSREKEVIGDALRNAGMRFGAALDLWHKGDLHKEEPDDLPQARPAPHLKDIAASFEKTKAAMNRTTQAKLEVKGPKSIDDHLKDLFKEKKLNENDILKACSRIAGREILSINELTAAEKTSLGTYVKAFK